jgi:hypothetical protein
MQLVHQNAALYNKGIPLMEAIAGHLKMVSGGVFEEIMGMPYDLK